jgi:transcriptional regulator with XRE-family HTH domain
VQDFQKQIGDTIRALRGKRGWSQNLFADKSGLNRAQVGEIELGESNVTIQTLKIVADTLGVKIVDLVLGLSFSAILVRGADGGGCFLEGIADSPELGLPATRCKEPGVARIQADCLGLGRFATVYFFFGTCITLSETGLS